MEYAVVTDLVILAGALAFVGWPLANPARADEDSTAREKRRIALDEEKERLLAGLADLDHDRATGKMEDADHLTLSSKLKAEAARVFREIDLNEGRRLLKTGEEPEPAPIPKAVAKAKKSSPPAKPVDRDDAPTVPGMKPRSLDEVESDAKFCTKCGRRAKAIDDRFCGRCGAALPEE